MKLARGYPGYFALMPVCINGHVKPEQGYCLICRRARNRRCAARRRARKPEQKIFPILATTSWRVSI